MLAVDPGGEGSVHEMDTIPIPTQPIPEHLAVAIDALERYIVPTPQEHFRLALQASHAHNILTNVVPFYPARPMPTADLSVPAAIELAIAALDRAIAVAGSAEEAIRAGAARRVLSDYQAMIEWLA